MLDSRYIRRAFENTIEVLGASATIAITEELRHNGVFLNDPDLTMEKLAHGTKSVIGGMATSLIMEQFFLELDSLYEMPMLKK